MKKNLYRQPRAGRAIVEGTEKPFSLSAYIAESLEDWHKRIYETVDEMKGHCQAILNELENMQPLERKFPDCEIIEKNLITLLDAIPDLQSASYNVIRFKTLLDYRLNERGD